MNDFFSKNQVLDLFNLLNENVEYILLRNINNELPSRLSKKKDIDIIVKESSLDILNTILLKNKWNVIRHPYSRVPFLYGMTPFIFYNKNGLHLDVCCQLSCRSLNKGEWFPLHMDIQKKIWKDKIAVNQPFITYMLSSEDEFVHLLTRCIFDKKSFHKDYINRIEFLLRKIDISVVKGLLELVFYKYTNRLIEMIENKRFEKIPQDYIQF